METNLAQKDSTQKDQREKDQQDIKGLSPFKKWLLRMGKKIYAGQETRPGWTGPTPLYYFYCQVCRRYIKDYPRGYGEVLRCPHCEQNRLSNFPANNF